jgi:hypothetical protein
MIRLWSIAADLDVADEVFDLSITQGTSSGDGVPLTILDPGSIGVVKTVYSRTTGVQGAIVRRTTSIGCANVLDNITP